MSIYGGWILCSHDVDTKEIQTHTWIRTLMCRSAPNINYVQWKDNEFKLALLIEPKPHHLTNYVRSNGDWDAKSYRGISFT